MERCFFRRLICIQFIGTAACEFYAPQIQASEAATFADSQLGDATLKGSIFEKSVSSPVQGVNEIGFCNIECRGRI
jgi:hypothetical protein